MLRNKSLSVVVEQINSGYCGCNTHGFMARKPFTFQGLSKWHAILSATHSAENDLVRIVHLNQSKIGKLGNWCYSNVFALLLAYGKNKPHQAICVMVQWRTDNRSHFKKKEPFGEIQFKFRCTQFWVLVLFRWFFVYLSSPTSIFSIVENIFIANC